MGEVKALFGFANESLKLGEKGVTAWKGYLESHPHYFTDMMAEKYATREGLAKWNQMSEKEVQDWVSNQIMKDTPTIKAAFREEQQAAEAAWKADKNMAHGGKGYTKFNKGAWAWKHKYKIAGATAAGAAVAAPKWTHDTLEEGAKNATDALKNLFGAAGDGVCEGVLGEDCSEAVSDASSTLMYVGIGLVVLVVLMQQK